MTTSSVVVPATLAHAQSLIQNGIRAVDREEWVAGTGHTVEDKLARAVSSDGAYLRAFIVGTRCLCIWGVHDAGLSKPAGQIWLIAAKEAERHVLSIHRHFTGEMAEIHARWPLLVAYCYGKNTLHQKWMERVGFEPKGNMILGLGFPFILYTRRDQNFV